MADKTETTITLQATISDRKGTYSYDYEWDMPVPKGITPVQEGLLQKGFGETLRDGFSTHEGSPDEKDAVARKRLAEFKAGTYKFGGGGGGGGIPLDTAAERAFFADYAKVELGMTKPKAITAWTKKKECWIEISRRVVLQQLQADEVTEEEMKSLDLDAMAADEETLQAVKELYQDEIAVHRARIEKEREARAEAAKAKAAAAATLKKKVGGIVLKRQ